MTDDPAVLDQVFWALSDATRRDVLRQLGQGGATVTQLAQPHGMSLPGFMKHLRVLEDAGLVAPERVWRAWTEPQALSRWFGRAQVEAVTRAELDVRVGGPTLGTTRPSDWSSS